MDVLDALGRVAEFTIGPSDPGLSTFFLFAGIVLVFTCFACRQDLLKQVKTIIVYIILIIVSHHIDIVVINHMAPAEDSTRTFTIIILIARLLRELFHYIQLSGVKVPPILSLRVNSMESAANELAEDQWDTRQIDEKISAMKRNIEKLEEYEKLRMELEQVKGGGM